MRKGLKILLQQKEEMNAKYEKLEEEIRDSEEFKLEMKKYIRPIPRTSGWQPTQEKFNQQQEQQLRNHEQYILTKLIEQRIAEQRIAEQRIAEHCT